MLSVLLDTRGIFRGTICSNIYPLNRCEKFIPFSHPALVEFLINLIPNITKHINNNATFYTLLPKYTEIIYI